MATIQYTEPRLVGGGLKEPRKFIGAPAPGAAWRRGDILVAQTTGSVSNPPAAGTGALGAFAGPAASAITLGTSASAGAPAQTYYGVVSYTQSGQESLLSAPFIINCPAGYLPTVSVASAGSPAGSTNFAAYLGIAPGQYLLQQATRTTTALGATFTATNPLTNSFGWARAATNVSTGIVGLADSMSNETFFDGPGGSFMVGPGSRTGANSTIPPLAPFEAQGLYAVGLGLGQLIEMNLNQNTAFYPNLVGTTAGLTLDATTGFFTVDPTQSNKILTIEDYRPGVFIGTTNQGSYGDLGVRVIVSVLASALAIQ